MNNEKHYNTLSEYYKFKYNSKIAKVSLNAGFTCPNKDGKKSFGGCTYCTPSGSGDFAGSTNKPLKEQFDEIKKIMLNKWPDSKFIPYLQANSNTYAPLEKLKEIYDEIASFENIVGIAIATRCDCLEDDKIEYLASLNKSIPVQIELGLQTIHEKTADKINRAHTLDEFVRCVKKLRENQIEIVVHIINGLPGETKEMMIETAKFLNTLDIQGVKIHSLLVLSNTKMGNDYLSNPFHILSLEEYVDITVEQIRNLNPNIIIHRLAADGVIKNLIEPKWTIKKLVVMNEIDKTLRRLNAYQGDYLGNSL